MITRFNLIRNVGQFDSVTTAAKHPFAPLTLIYAENGRGKTTLSAILRSLATGDPIPISERRRLAAQHPPHAIVACTGGPPDAMFQNGEWNRTLPDVVIFDDVFVDQNVYSGLVVGSDHRQNLHELILGYQGVALNQQLQIHIARIEQHNTKIRQRGSAIPANERGILSIEDFCALQENPNIDQEIQTAEQNVAASREHDLIHSAPNFQLLNLPSLELASIEQVIQAGVPALDAAAASRVQAHLATVGAGAEEWAASGMRLQDERSKEVANQCVFCAQDLTDSPVITHYRAFFSDAYRDLQRGINDASATLNHDHSGDATVIFERAARVLTERHHFWSRFADVPEVEIDSRAIINDWNLARDRVAELLTQKQAAPLDAIGVPDNVRAAVDAYEAHRAAIARLNQQLNLENQVIANVKKQAATANPVVLTTALARLRSVKSRGMLEIAELCDAYLAEKQAKAAAEIQRNQARAALDQYRTNVFPNYEAAINRYLGRFNVGYRLDSVTATNTRGGPTCTYNVVINSTPVTVGGGNPQPGEHSFKNVLSAGDRSALALAFFFASLELDPNRANKVVVIDDPVSSLDEHRSLTTVQEIRHLANQVSQVIVLSHTKKFLCQIWKNADSTVRTALHVVRDGNGSTIASWDVDEDSITENDRRHAMFREYLVNGNQNEKHIASSIRPSLEAFFRVAYPEFFPPGMLLGSFRRECDKRVGTAQKILSQLDIDELRDIVEYANYFHHDTNPSLDTKAINSTQLEGFVRRTLEFAKRP